MVHQQNQVDSYQIVIIECCQNCQSHQSFSRHSEWKYFEQFNQLKRKLEKFVNNVIVVKNPIPDELTKPPQAKLSINTYLNRETKQTVVFPRIGSFEVYIYNVLIYSKLITNSWPNHYKIVQLVTKIIEAKKKGDSLQQFSVFQKVGSDDEDYLQRNNNRSGSKKKKNRDFRVYKNKEKGSTIQPTPRQASIKKISIEAREKTIEDQLQSNKKQGRRVLLKRDKQSGLDIRSSNQSMELFNESHKPRLPSLRNSNTKPVRRQSVSTSQQKNGLINNLQKKYSMRDQPQKRADSKQKHLQTLQKNDISRISRRPSAEDYRFNSLILEANQSLSMEENMKSRLGLGFLEDNRQGNQPEKEQKREYANKSIQCQQNQGFYCDFGLQVDVHVLTQNDSFYVQTDRVQFSDSKKQDRPIWRPQMADKQVLAHITAKEMDTNQCQTTITLATKYIESQTNTQSKFLINKGSQFPESNQIKQILSKQVELNLTIDQSFIHLYEKRKNILDNNYYSIDKFQEKATKYKWIGRADKNLSAYQVIKKFMLECLVFCYYDFFHVKTSQKRLSYQSTGNVLSEDTSIKTLLHVMTLENPQIKSMNQFQQYNSEQMRYPTSEVLTYKVNKQTRKFASYGQLLALAYFIRDTQIFDKDKQCIGVIINNREIQSIVKVSSDDYEIPTNGTFIKNKIIVEKGNKEGAIFLERTSEEVQKQFIQTLIRITNDANFSLLLRYFEQTFVHMTSQNKVLKNAILSIKVDKIDSNIYEEFIEMLKNRKQLIEYHHKGEIYSYRKYGTLQPKIVFSLENYDKKREEGAASRKVEQICFATKFMHEGNKVQKGEVQKYLSKKDTIVVLTADPGTGKTTCLQQISKSLEQKNGDKLIIKSISKQILLDQSLWKKKIDQILEERRKQLYIFDDAEQNLDQTTRFLERLHSQRRSTKLELSFCLAFNEEVKLKINISGVQIAKFTLLGIQIEEIRNYLMKNILYFNYSQKKAFLEKLLGPENAPYNESNSNSHIIKLIRKPFYLHLYGAYLNQIQNIENPSQIFPINFGKYFLLKEAFTICYNRHSKQCKHMQVKFEDCFFEIRKIAFEYYLSQEIINENIRQVMRKFNSEEVISNQLTFYPINMKVLMGNDSTLFLHREYFNYFVVDAYSYYLQKAYRNLSLDKLYENQTLFALMKEKYHIEKAYPSLIKVIEASRKYKSTWEQASNAITFLNKLQYVFSNLNFDQVEIPEANLSQGVFYNCSFRGANMTNTILYKTQMISCGVEGAVMDNINFYEKKFEIEYTVLSAALSMDGKNVALGCGNFLIIIHAQTGKELKKIQAHMDIIRTVKYSKDNSTLISIADDKTLRIWDTHTYKSIVFKLPQKGAIAFSSETDMIASVIKNNLKVWNIKSMANEFQLQGHSDMITCLEFSQDGKHIITGSKDTTVRIWSSRKGEIIRTFKGHSAQISALEISQNNTKVLSSSKDKDIIVWSFDNGNEINKTTLIDEVTEICLDGKQKFVVIGMAKQNTITFLFLQTLEIAYRLERHRGRILSLNFNNDYKKLVSLSKDKTVKIWDFEKIIDFQYQNYLRNKRKKLKVTSGPILGLAFSKVQNKFATSHQNGEINIYSGMDNEHLDQVVSHEGPVRCLQYDKSGKLYSGGSNGICKVWNLQSKREPKNYDLFTSEIIELKLNQRFRIIAMSSANNEFVVVDFTGIKIILTTREEGRVQAIQFSKDQKIMAVGGSQTSIAIYQVLEGDKVSRKQQLGPNNESIVCMTFQGDAYLVAALKNSQIAIWNHLKNALIKKIQNPSPIKSLLTFQRKYVCFSSEDSKLRVIDMEEGRQAKVFRYGEKCSKFVVNYNESLIYQSTETGNIVVWNLGNLKQAPKERIEFDRIAYDEDGLKVVQVQGSRELLIRDLHNHNQNRLKIKDLSSEIDGVTFYKGKIILLLKNGVHWELGKKQFSFGIQTKAEGDLYWVKDKTVTNIFKTPIRKIKGIRKPIQSVIEDISS